MYIQEAPGIYTSEKVRTPEGRLTWSGGKGARTSAGYYPVASIGISGSDLNTSTSFSAG